MQLTFTGGYWSLDRLSPLLFCRAVGHTTHVPETSTSGWRFSHSCNYLSMCRYWHTLPYLLLSLRALGRSARSASTTLRSCQFWRAPQARRASLPFSGLNMDDNFRCQRVLSNIYASSRVAYISRNELVLLVYSGLLHNILGVCRIDAIHYMPVFRDRHTLVPSVLCQVHI